MGNPTLVIEGSWIGQSRFVKSEVKSYSVNTLFADASGSNEDDTNSKKGIQVAPIEEQGEMESRRVWKDVAEGIRKGDFENAGIAKSKLENEQRSKRKTEKEGGNTHQLHKFKAVQSDEECKCGFFNLFVELQSFLTVETVADTIVSVFLLLDHKLAQMFGFQPSTEDGYLYVGSLQ